MPKGRQLSPFRRPLRYTYVAEGCGNRAARRIIPLLRACGDNRVTCGWLQRLRDTPQARVRYNRDGWAIQRAIDLDIRDKRKGKPLKDPEGLHGATPAEPVLVMTVRKDYIRMDLHISTNEFESSDFAPPGLVAALVEAAARQRGDNLMGYALAIKDTGAGTNFRGSPLHQCFGAAWDYAAKTFGLMGTGQREIDLSQQPTSHPLQRAWRCEFFHPVE